MDAIRVEMRDIPLRVPLFEGAHRCQRKKTDRRLHLEDEKTVVLAADFASRLWGENFVQRPVLKSVPEQRIQVLE
jgi:hypothetical protein